MNNWSPTGTPASGSSLVFGTPGASDDAIVDDLPSTFTAATINFLTTAGSYTIGTSPSSPSTILNLGTAITDSTTAVISFDVNTTLSTNITINPVSLGTVDFASPISGTGTITKVGGGRLIFGAVSPFVGNLMIGADANTSGSAAQVPLGGGIVEVDLTNSNGVLPSTATVSIGGSTFAAEDLNSSTVSLGTQVLAGLQVQAGFSTVQAFATSGKIVLNLGTVAAGANNLDNKADQVEFMLPTGTQTASNGILVNNLNTNGILISNSMSAFTVGTTDWAAVNVATGNIIPYTGYTHYTTGSTNLGGTIANVDIQHDGAPTTQTVQTLRFNTPATTGLTGTLTIAATATLTVSAGGILVTPSVGSTNLTIAAGDATSTLKGASNHGLSIFQYNTAGTLTINAIIADNGATANALTIGGGGAVILGGANTYTNSTVVGQYSTLEISSNANLGSQTANGSVNLNKGTLTALSTFTLGSGANNRAVGLGTSGGTIDVTGTNTLTIPGVISDSPANPGTLTKTDSGTLVLSGMNSYNGGTILNGGTLVAASASATSNGNVTMDGGVLANTAAGSIAGNVVSGDVGLHTIAPGGLNSVGTLSIHGFTSDSFSTLNFDLGTGAGPIITNGDLLTLGAGTVSIGVATQLSFGGAAPTSGLEYRLIGGNTSGINLANFQLPTAPIGDSFSLVKNSGFIDLLVGTVPNLEWNNFAGTGAWNGTDQNFNNGTTNSVYSDGSLVTFDDNNGGAGNYNVTLNSTVNPGSVTINNSAGNYVISGTGSIRGTTGVTKLGPGTATIGTANIYSGVTTVSAGTLVEAVNQALPTYSTVQITGGTLQLGASIGLQNMMTLAISGNGTLDINNNHLIMPDSMSGPNFLSSVAAMIASGYNGGLWNGPGIISSAAALDPTHYGLGYADGSDPGNPAGLSSGFLEVAYTLLGDANLDRAVNGVDFGILAANFNHGVSAWDEGDFNYDGVDNGVDFGLLAANFNKGASGASAADVAALDAFAAANGLLADVPEPATTGLIALGAAGMLGRRRRR
jgi:autotransporter-associated beta strand protein